MFPVNPVSSHSGTAAHGSATLPIHQGRFFSYAMPEGWSVGEEGQFALTLMAPDRKALTLMVGNSGLPPHYAPGQFVHDKLMALRPQNLHIGPARQVTPRAGFAQAYEFEVHYSMGSNTAQGIAKVNIAPAYDSAMFVMTAALANTQQWGGYANWLPLVSEQIQATNGAAFGRRGVMAQNLHNSQEFGEAARRYREWSEQNWKKVTDDRWNSTDRRQAEFRKNLGPTHNYVNPYDTRFPLELPSTYQYYWVNRQGKVLGTDDPSANPNYGSTDDWKQMPRHKQ